MTGKQVYSKEAIILAKQTDGLYYPIACVEDMQHQQRKEVVEEVGLGTGYWAQMAYSRSRSWDVSLRGVTLLTDVAGSWAAAELEAALESNAIMSLKFVLTDEEGRVMQLEHRARLREIGYSASLGDGGEPAKWNAQLSGCGSLEYVPDVWEWMWSSNVGMLWSSGTIMDLIGA